MEWAVGDRPRKKMLDKGLPSLSEAERIAILIGPGNPEESAVEVSRRITVSANNNLNELGKKTIADFQIPNVSSEKMQNLHTNSKKEKLHVLVAEDDIHSRMFLKTLLSLEGIIVYEAVNGKKAIEMVERFQEIDLVLIDMRMPELDGLEATKIIKTIRPDLPVIAQTAYAMKEDIEKARQAGCDDYITKPVKKQLLMEKINKLV